MMITFYSTVDSSSLAILSYYRPIHRSVAEAATPYQSSLVCCRQQHSSSVSTNAANKLHVSSRQPHSRHSFFLTHFIGPVPSSFYFSPFLSVPHFFTLRFKLICSESPFVVKITRGVAVAEGPRDASCRWNLVKWCTTVRKTAFEKVCNGWMTIVSFPKYYHLFMKL